MQDFGTKADNSPPPGGQLSAAEFNNLATEAENAVLRSGQTLSGASVTQLALSLFLHSVKSESFQDSGAANAYVATPVSGTNGVLLPADYTSMAGATFSFKASNNNSGASTLNIGQTTGTLLGVKPIRTQADTPVLASAIVAGQYIQVRYNAAFDSGNGAWELLPWSTLAQVGIQGNFKNMVSSTTGTTAVVTFTADEFTLKNAANTYLTLRALSLSASTGAASGAVNSLDTGAWANATWYARHIIYNPTTNVTGILWSLSRTAPLLPSGFTFWAYTGQWERTQGATNFNPLSMQWIGREGSYIKRSAGNVTQLPIMSTGAIGAPGVPTYAALAWAAFAPPDTYSIDIMARAGTPGNSVIGAPNNTYGRADNTTGIAPPIAYVPQGASNSPLSIRQWMPLEDANVYYATDDAGFGILQCFGFKTRG